MAQFLSKTFHRWSPAGFFIFKASVIPKIIIVTTTAITKNISRSTPWCKYHPDGKVGPRLWHLLSGRHHDADRHWRREGRASRQHRGLSSSSPSSMPSSYSSSPCSSGSQLPKWPKLEASGSTSFTALGAPGGITVIIVNNKIVIAVIIVNFIFIIIVSECEAWGDTFGDWRWGRQFRDWWGWSDIFTSIFSSPSTLFSCLAL